MYRFMSYIQNYVEIKITGEKPQKFINICLRRRLADMASDTRFRA